MQPRTADPYKDTAIIDSRAPRFNQTVVSILCIASLITGLWWIAGLMGLQLIVGLLLGRKYCLPCRAYFAWIQPRWGEGELEDARPPRLANILGATFLIGASLFMLAGVTVVGWILIGMVAILATLAWTTGFCMGCWLYIQINGECEVCAPLPRA